MCERAGRHAAAGWFARCFFTHQCVCVTREREGATLERRATGSGVCPQLAIKLESNKKGEWSRVERKERGRRTDWQGQVGAAGRQEAYQQRCDRGGGGGLQGVGGGGRNRKEWENGGEGFPTSLKARNPRCCTSQREWMCQMGMVAVVWWCGGRGGLQPQSGGGAAGSPGGGEREQQSGKREKQSGTELCMS